MKCDSCQKPNNDELIFETKFWKVIIASDQEYLGRCYVILKRHCGDLDELENSEWSDFTEVVKKLENALRKSFNATMFNWSCLMNNAYQNIPPNPHVHWHLRPRYDHKVEIEGLIFKDIEFGHHYDRIKKREISEDIKNKIVKKIRNSL